MDIQITGDDLYYKGNKVAVLVEPSNAGVSHTVLDDFKIAVNSLGRAPLSTSDQEGSAKTFGGF